MRSEAKKAINRAEKFGFVPPQQVLQQRKEELFGKVQKGYGNIVDLKEYMSIVFVEEKQRQEKAREKAQLEFDFD